MSPSSTSQSFLREIDKKVWIFADKLAWVQHMLHHLAPNGSMSSNSSGEGDICRALIEADLVECMVALPGQLFTNTQIPACIWFLARTKRSHCALAA